MIENREQLIEIIKGIDNPTPANINTIYEGLRFLRIPFKKTTCGKCRRDYLNIIKEELGLIDNAADQSDFNENKCYRYLLKRSQVFNGHLINGQTAIEVIREFVKKHPVGYYEEMPCEEVPSFEEKDSVPEQTTETEEVAEEQTENIENLENK